LSEKKLNIIESAIKKGMINPEETEGIEEYLHGN
jgi:hypothetical protein